MANAERRRPVVLLNMAVDVVKNRECEVLISQYAQRVAASGAIPMPIPSIEDAEITDALLDLADGVLFIGGKDYDPRSYGEAPHPETQMTRLRNGFDIMLCRAALKRELPVLGICAGCQLLAIATGGKLVQHLDDAERHTNGVLHQATITAPGFFARALDGKVGEEYTVNSFHHQAVDQNAPGADFCITARAFDGTVEAIERPGERMVLGVQFHPERMDDLGPKFFDLLAGEAARFGERRKLTS